MPISTPTSKLLCGCGDFQLVHTGAVVLSFRYLRFWNHLSHVIVTCACLFIILLLFHPWSWFRENISIPGACCFGTTSTRSRRGIRAQTKPPTCAGSSAYCWARHANCYRSQATDAWYQNPNARAQPQVQSPEQPTKCTSSTDATWYLYQKVPLMQTFVTVVFEWGSIAHSVICGGTLCIECIECIECNTYPFQWFTFVWRTNFLMKCLSILKYHKWEFHDR